jgi:hypothetical protein
MNPLGGTAMRTLGTYAATLWLAAVAVAAEPPEADSATVRFLRARRNDDGGYPNMPRPGHQPPPSSLRATASALRALKYLGGEPEQIADTTRFVERCYDKDTGGFGDAAGAAPTVFTTAVGVTAATELKVPADPYRDGAVKFLTERVRTLEEVRIAAAAFEAIQLRPPKADDWLRQIEATRNPDGTFGSGTGVARATGGTAAMILRLGGSLDRRHTVLKAMRDGQRSDGGFGTGERAESDLESTYRVMRAFAMMKAQPADPATLRAFVARCRSATGGYADRAGDPPTVAGTYFAVSILRWLDQR